MVVGGGCKVIFNSNPTIRLRLGWGFDNKLGLSCEQVLNMLGTSQEQIVNKIWTSHEQVKFQNFSKTWPVLTWPVLTWLVLTWPILTSLVLTYQITIQTSHRYPPDTFRHLPDTLKTPSRNPLDTHQTPPPDTLQTISIHPPYTHKTVTKFQTCLVNPSTWS